MSEIKPLPCPCHSREPMLSAGHEAPPPGIDVWCHVHCGSSGTGWSGPSAFGEPAAIAAWNSVVGAARERDEFQMKVAAILDAQETLDKLSVHPPGSGINDPDYPGPTDDEIDAYEAERAQAVVALDEAIRAAFTKEPRP